MSAATVTDQQNSAPLSATLAFVEPPFGLEPTTAFTLTEVSGSAGLFSLRAEDQGGIRLFVLDAGQYLPDYTPELTDEQCDAIDVKAPEDVLLLVVANPGADGITVNQRAPIVVNVHTGAAAQVILESDAWPLRAELAARTA
ncbi:flagellar assembly protein FliW [Microbacterium sp. STN6]|uniref:flagellar assembly protein FliW n=1 Tax=Microbacterium sp. STN6 TaxID=2995588 RepID=UPI00226095B2|nr:flagellar assembly protein FliW [Microbacterium sp. STN6]MCX7522367.1 flagellar assembly protein FliW [Microbacterium sp. STN6]